MLLLKSVRVINMPLSIRIISSPDGESITEWNCTFPEDGGEIGRMYGSTLQLSDSSRTVSGTHAIIRKSSRGYQILDNSTNGLFINGSTSPLGKGNQSTLNDGDVLDIGRYRLLVSCFIPTQASATMFSSEHSNIIDMFGDDPFGQTSEDELEADSQLQDAEETDNSNTPLFPYGPEELQEDPFRIKAVSNRQEHQVFTPIFSETDDDPFQEQYFSVPQSNHAEANLRSQSVQHLAEFKSNDEFQQQIEKAIEMALARLLSDLSPQVLEGMFKDLNVPNFFSRKPKYWEMYKRYFSRQLQNRDWQSKFHVYFQDSLRLQNRLGGRK